MSSPAAATPTLSAIGQIALVMRDVGQATTFYRDVLGLKFLFAAGPNLAFFAAGSVRLMLASPQEGFVAGQNSTLYFKVDDAVATHAAIVARGAKAEHAPQLTAKMPDHELWIGFVRDLDGNLVGLMEERR
jgi:predicted enzyme related to lactoylglutathione lyase